MRTLIVSGTLALLSSSGCYTRPMMDGGPATSPEGVRVALLGQQCGTRLDGDPPTLRQWLDLEVSVQNDSRSESFVRPDAVALRAPGGAILRSVKVGGPFALAPGASWSLTTLFVDERFRCDAEVDVLFDGAVTIAGRPASIPSLHLRAW